MIFFLGLRTIEPLTVEFRLDVKLAELVCDVLPVLLVDGLGQGGLDDGHVFRLL